MESSAVKKLPVSKVETTAAYLGAFVLVSVGTLVSTIALKKADNLSFLFGLITVLSGITEGWAASGLIEIYYNDPPETVYEK